MCRGVAKVHAGCGHHRAKEIHAQCASGYDPNFGCRANRLWVQQIIIHAPPLCRNCYCTQEAEICDDYNRRIENSLGHLAGARERLQEEQEDHERGLKMQERGQLSWSVMQGHEFDLATTKALIESWEHTIKGLRENKATELKNFRDQMGVWGDG